MSAKQDRVYTRTAAQVEQKYKFGKSFAEIAGIATDARETAAKAQDAVDNLDNKLTQDEIFNRLTNNGEEQGIYREDGKIYVNGTYMRFGTIDAAIVKIINLIAELVNSINEEGDYVKIENGCIVAGSESSPSFSLAPVPGTKLFMLSFDNITPEGDRVSSSFTWNRLSLGAINESSSAFRIIAERESELESGFVKIKLPCIDVQSRELYAYWRENDDGTFSLIGSTSAIGGT